MNILFNIKDTRMSNKYYSLLVLAVANINGYVDTRKTNARIVSKSSLIFAMTELFNISPYIRRKIFSALEETGACRFDEENVYITPVSPPFITISDEIVEQLIEQAYEMDYVSAERMFKTYCYLYQKQKMHRQFFKGDNAYFFSNSEILDATGYSRSQRNIDLMTDTLDLLVELELIRYNKLSFGNYNQKGVYHPLYYVKGV